MRPPRTLLTALLGLSIFALAPIASADEQVEFHIDFNAPMNEVYDDIRAQAWAFCAPEQKSHHVSARINARRVCQKALIKDVLAQLPDREKIRLAAFENRKTDR